MTWFQILEGLFARLFISLIIFSLLCRTSLIRHTINTLEENLISRLKLIALFSLFSFLDIFCSTLTPANFINNKTVFVISAGLIGGPFVGFVTALSCIIFSLLFISYDFIMPSVLFLIFEGLASGFLSKWLHEQEKIYADASAIGFSLTFVYLAVFALFRPENAHLAFTLEDAFFPVMFSAAVGTGSFIGILEDFYNQQDKIEGISAKTALKIINNSISILQNGLDFKSAQETADIIIREAETFDFVAITSMEEILGFTSYRTEKPFLSFLKQDFLLLFKSNFDLPATNLDVIRAFMNIPIFDDKRQIGYLCVGHILIPDITPFERTLADGIGTMISNQITVHNIKVKAELFAQAEIKALQSQINPHFLFNSLSTISYYCSEQPQTAKSLINDLANYYRKNLTDANTLISIRNELQHINAYIHLEQARFGERLKVNYEINTEDMFNLPALILQPIVENAIRHGLYPKVEGGVITIRIDQKQSYFRIAVTDDGLGIEKDYLKTVLRDDIPKKSIGLSNVNQRLVILYGSSFKLRIHSRVNKGTIVIMRIPLKEVSSEND